MNQTMTTPPPALGICRGQRLTNRKIAAELGVSEDWVSKVLLGYAKPPARFRDGLVTLTGVSAGALFGEAPAIS
jgi:transcriptional regulator with XRE-family HTH domain